MAEPGSWVDAPKGTRLSMNSLFFLFLILLSSLDAIIVGLKELPEGDFPLVHSHIFFAHIYKV